MPTNAAPGAANSPKSASAGPGKVQISLPDSQTALSPTPSAETGPAVPALPAAIRQSHHACADGNDDADPGHDRRPDEAEIANGQRVTQSHAEGLTGERAHTFRLALSGRGRQLVGLRGRLPSQLLIAIPGGRLFRGLLLRG